MARGREIYNPPASVAYFLLSPQFSIAMLSTHLFPSGHSASSSRHCDSSLFSLFSSIRSRPSPNDTWHDERGLLSEYAPKTGTPIGPYDHDYTLFVPSKNDKLSHGSRLSSSSHDDDDDDDSPREEPRCRRASSSIVYHFPSPPARSSSSSPCTLSSTASEFAPPPSLEEEDEERDEEKDEEAVSTCIQSLHRQLLKISLDVQFKIFRMKRRLRRRWTR